MGQPHLFRCLQDREYPRPRLVRVRHIPAPAEPGHGKHRHRFRGEDTSSLVFRTLEIRMRRSVSGKKKVLKITTQGSLPKVEERDPRHRGEILCVSKTDRSVLIPC